MLLLLAASNFVGGGKAKTFMILAGVALACIILATNLGARAWHNLGFPSLKYTGTGSTAIAYLISTFLGIFTPYLGFREVEVGGQAAVESFILSALIVGIVFILSDIDILQTFIVAGSQACNQEVVNIIIGAWFFISLNASLVLSPFIKSKTRNLDEEEFLEESERSPVGFICRNLPNFYVVPSLISKPTLCCNENVVRALGGLIAVIVGAAIISIGLFKTEIQQFAKLAW